MHNIASWNVRGLNNPNKQEDVKLFLNKSKIGLVGLMETKVRKENEMEVSQRLFGGWQWHTNASREEKGILWVA